MSLLSENPYKPPRELPVKVESVKPKAKVRKWLVGFLGCLLSWMVGLFGGAWIAKAYERMMYPPELDPVHFDVGGVFLLAWLVIGFTGSLVFIVRALYGSRSAGA
ncbi:MAG TPA: hypothetical protein VMP01_05710 [Pirellulaceae bacterium]|nr:hypothetical protein [Pirellulaceae bacterium]